MNEKQRQQLIDALLYFVERVSKSATMPAEVEALVQIAQILPYMGND